MELYDPLSKESTDLHSMLYESENITRMATDTVEVRLPGKASGIFPGRCLSGYLVDHGAKERLYTMQLKSAYTTEAQRRSPMSITPSLTPMTVYYREAAENGIAKGAFLHNRWPDQYAGKGGRAHLGAAYPAKSHAAQRLYRYLKLFDPERVKPGQRKSNAFLGAFRLGGMPPHTAEVAVDCTGVRPRRGMHTGPASYLGAEFPYASEAPGTHRPGARGGQNGQAEIRPSFTIHHQSQTSDRQPVPAGRHCHCRRVPAGGFINGAPG